MKSISDFIWGDIDIVPQDNDEDGDEIQLMSFNCMEMCCGGTPPPNPTSFIGCK